jgi:hypothetical protein
MMLRRLTIKKYFLWIDATSREMAQLDEYKCFEELGPDEKCPPDY